MATATRSSSRDKVRAHRARTRSKAFTRQAHLECLKIANSPHARDDQAFVDAVSVWKFESLPWPGRRYWPVT